MKIEQWSDYFKLNESHIEGKDEQCKWICKVVKDLNEKDMKKLYNYIEKEFNLEDK